jgi:hypothetical protein
MDCYCFSADVADLPPNSKYPKIDSRRDRGRLSYILHETMIGQNRAVNKRTKTLAGYFYLHRTWIIAILLLGYILGFIVTISNFTMPSTSLKTNGQSQSITVTVSQPIGKTLWFTAVSVHSPIHLAHLQAIIHSSIHIHSIFPVVIVSGNISLAPDWLVFLNSSCVGIIHHDLSFANRTNHSDPNHLAYFLRIDIPLIVDELRTFPKYQSLGIQFDYVLYTDTDVLFTNEFNLSVLPLPKVLTLGPEHLKGTISNTGVLYMNITAMQAHLPKLLDYADSKNWNFTAYDQGLLIEYFCDKLHLAELLPDSFNWKPYWGVNPNASIIHFHGAKPGLCAECFASGSYPDFGSGCACPAYQAVSGATFTNYGLSFAIQSSSYAYYLGLYHGHKYLFQNMTCNTI